MEFEENGKKLAFYASYGIDYTKGSFTQKSITDDRVVLKKSLVVEDEVVVDITLQEALSNGDGFVDVRSSKAFREVHLKDSTNMTLGHIKTMRCLLPPPGAKLSLVAGSKRDLELAKTELISYRYHVIFTAEWSQVIERAEDSLLEYKSSFSRQLWKPSPLLAISLPKIESRVENHRNLCFLDIGAGAGRDLIFSARRGWTSIGVDHLASHCDRFHTILSVLNSNGESLDCKYHKIDVIENPKSLPRADVVHIGRFLHRPLLLHIRDHVVLPGGYFLMHTFMEGCEKFGSPKKPKFLLKSGELASVFGERWTVLMDEVRPITDGRPLSYFMASKNK